MTENRLHETGRDVRSRKLVPESALPARYQTPWKPGFVAEALLHARPGTTILDVGGGDRPTLSPCERPEGCRYIGLDPDASGLNAGAYDERIDGGASDQQPHLIGEVDLILSWNVLEHVPDMSAALDRFYELLRPGGIFLARFAGRWAFFAIASRTMPHRVRTRLLTSLLDADEDDHFPTRYDRCSARQFDAMLRTWTEHKITPLYRGAGYFAFSRPLQRAYLAYEAGVAMRTPQLATHYQVRAVK